MNDFWPADQVERWPIDRLTPYARNARRHSEKQIAQIAASIKEWGWTIPVLADEEGGLICGHDRVLAAQKLGIAEIPVMIARGWSEAKKRAYILADNKLTLNGAWDDELLAIELADLSEMNFDISLTGFGDAELKNLGVGGLGFGGDAQNEAPSSVWAVIVECTDEAQQVELIERLQGEGFQVRGSIS